MKIPIDKFEAYLRNKNLKDRSIEMYIYYFNKFTFDRFNQESVSRFLAVETNRNSIPRAFLVNLKKFLMVNSKELSIDDNYYKEIAAVELPQLTGRKKAMLVNPIPHEQISLLEDALNDEKYKLMMLLTYYCGLRMGELLKITPISFNWEIWKKDISKMGECKVFGKGSKEGIALVPSNIMIRIGRYIKTLKLNSVNVKIFNPNDREKGVGRTWEIRLREAGIKSGITKLDEEKKPIKETAVYPHRLRHSCGSHLLNDKGLDIREVQEVLRHSSIESTQIYTKVNKEKLKERLS